MTNPSKKTKKEDMNDKELIEAIIELTKELKKIAKGCCNSSLFFKRGYTDNPNITYEQKA